MIFLKKERPDAKTTYYGSLPARIRNGWANNNNSSANISSSANNNHHHSTVPLRPSWRNMRIRKKSEKDKENSFNITGGEYNTVKKDNQNHENAAKRQANESKLNNTKKKSAGGGPIGTEAMIEQHLERNAKIFKYPPQGYWTRIELSILYSMILEPTIFPPEAVCEHVHTSQAEFDSAPCTDSSQPQHFMEPYLYERPPPGQYTAQMTVSYRQFVALLVLAGEEWTAESKVPQTLCHSMVQCIVQYCDRHGLDRRIELEEGLRKPLESYSRRRTAKITLSSMWPVYLGAMTSALTMTAVPLGLGYIASIALNEKHVQKESVAEENRMQYQLSMERAAHPEHESILEENDSPAYPYQEEEEEIQLWDDEDEARKKKEKNLFDETDDGDYGFVAQELKQQQHSKTATSALAGAGSMLLLGNSIRAQQQQQQDEETKKPAYIKAAPMEIKTAYSDDVDEEDDDNDDLL